MNELMLSELGVFSFWFFAGIGVLILIDSIVSQRKSQKYRKFLSDMFVSQKIRALAKDESLDIVFESEEFKKWSKKEKLSQYNYDLDNTIENELKEKVQEPLKKGK